MGINNIHEFFNSFGEEKSMQITSHVAGKF